MIDKNDVVLLLTEMKNKGIDTTEDIKLVLKSQSIPLNVIKKINNYKPLDVLNFYEKVRSSYNNKKSKLYINIMKSDENTINNPKTVLTTLSALLNQILLYDAEDKTMFYEHSRASEISKVLDIYFNKFDINPAYKLLQLTKADIVALEYIGGRREISQF